MVAGTKQARVGRLTPAQTTVPPPQPSDPCSEFRIVLTSQWPVVRHECSDGQIRTVRFGVCRDGVQETCHHCERTFMYVKCHPNPADGYQWGSAEERRGDHG